jgi:hypothetical protein
LREKLDPKGFRHYKKKQSKQKLKQKLTLPAPEATPQQFTRKPPYIIRIKSKRRETHNTNLTKHNIKEYNKTNKIDQHRPQHDFHGTRLTHKP